MSESKKGYQEPQNLETSKNTHFMTRRTSIHHVEKIYVDEETYYEWNKYVNQHRKKAQRNGECLCPKAKLWQCDTVCDECPFFNRDKFESLDVPQFSDDDDSEMKVDYVVDPSTEDMEERIILQLTMEHLIDELKDKEPELALILFTLYEEIKNNTFTNLLSLCEKLPMSTSTFYHRVERLRKIFVEKGLKK